MHATRSTDSPRPSCLSALSFDSVVDGALDMIVRRLGTRLAAVSRIEGATYTIMAVVDQHGELQPSQVYDLRSTICAHMLETGQPLFIGDLTQAPVSCRTAPLAQEIGIRSFAGVPLYMTDGRVFGTLWVADREPRDSGDQDLALLCLMGRLLLHEIDIDLERRHVERIAHLRASQPGSDPLTGLMSRRDFEEQVQRQARRRAQVNASFSVAVIALDPPDDLLGDAFRQELAEIVMRTSRLVDCCARIGENEFAVLFIDTPGSGADSWQTRLMAALDTWNFVHTASGLKLHARIGIADHRDAETTGRSVLDAARSKVAAHPVLAGA